MSAQIIRELDEAARVVLVYKIKCLLNFDLD